MQSFPDTTELLHSWAHGSSSCFVISTKDPASQHSNTEGKETHMLPHLTGALLREDGESQFSVSV